MKQLKSKFGSVVISITLAFTGFLFCLYLNNLYISYKVAHPESNVLSYQDSLKVKVLQYGDTIAYQEMKTILQSQNLSHEIWFYSIVMAKQFHYTPANNDVYETLMTLYEHHDVLGDMDFASKNFIMQFQNERIK